MAFLLLMMVAGVGDDAREGSSQRENDEGLYGCDQELVEIKGNERKEGDVRIHLIDRIQKVFSTEDVTEKAEGEGERANEENRQDFNPANEEEDDDKRPVC